MCVRSVSNFDVVLVQLTACDQGPLLLISINLYGSMDK